MPVDNSVFARNQRALDLFDPRTAACIARISSLPATGVRPTVRQSAWSPPELKPEDTVILQGIGDGAEILRLLAQPFSRILVVECDRAACISVLHHNDFSTALAEGRLRLFLVPADSPVTREISLRECTSELVACLHGRNGTLHFVATATTPARSEFFDALRRGVQEAARTIGELTRARASTAAYDVTVISPCCAIFDDLARCFHNLGLRIQLLRVPDNQGTWTSEQLRNVRSTLASAPSRLVVTRNRALFETEEPTGYPQPEALVPGHVAMWWWDVPNLATYIDLRHPRGNTRAFGFARDILPLLPQGAEWLPPGARMAFVEAGTQPEIAQDIDVSFVGQSRLQNLHANLRHLGKVLHDLGGNAPALARDIEQSRGYVWLHDYLKQHHRDIQDAIAPIAAAYPAHAYYLHYLLEMAVSGSFRIAAIEKVSGEGVDVAIYGDDDWLKVAGVNARNFKGLIAPEDLPTLYRRSRINLNLNFMQVSSTVNPKVLDIAATGSVVLTDHRPELELLYSDPAARPFAFHGLHELSGKIDALRQADLTHHRKAVLMQTCQNHTLQQRALWLAQRFGLL
ncbi:glycosyltransferase [Noviherbaspirillum denitrificans]|uniref:Spore protein YkvP/CgeB glycosyl transferase-like domain-containing protein n=1 Tax=Noviherbaspirillum denitrificans TaxID=1968433 RepID=A0A254TF94_9BURK|nr:glycosyltransferase [Noviherbaspirillum denitrificans]OWW21300.1 hypothetical protein AYR66_19290 [Noviherbaspirillum denitrificans]